MIDGLDGLTRLRCGCNVLAMYCDVLAMCLDELRCACDVLVTRSTMRSRI